MAGTSGGHLEVIWSKPLLKEGHPEPDGAWAPLRRARLHLLCSLPLDISISGDDPPSLLCSRLNGPSSLCPSSLESCSSPFPILVALRWTPSSLCPSLLSWGAQHWTQASRGGLSGADPLPGPAGNAPPHTAQDTLGRLCWLKFNVVSTRTPGAFSAELLSSRAPSACPGAWGRSSPGAAFDMSLG